MGMKLRMSFDIREALKIPVYIVTPALIFLACQCLLKYVFDILWPSVIICEGNNAISSCVFLPFVVLAYGSKFSFSSLLKYMKLAVSFSVAIAVGSLLLLYLQIAAKYETEFLLYILGVGIAGPIVEEIIYRGFVFERSQVYFQDWQVIFLNALLFAVGHNSITTIAVAFLAGIIFSVAMRQTKKLLIPILLHIGWNLMQLL